MINLHLKKEFPKNFSKYRIINIEEDYVYFFIRKPRNQCILKYSISTNKTTYFSRIPNGDMIIFNGIKYSLGYYFQSYDLTNQNIINEKFGNPVGFYNTIILLNDGRIATSTNEGGVGIWDTNGLVKIIAKDQTQNLYAVCQLSNDDIVTGHEMGIRFYDLQTGELKRFIEKKHHGHPTSLYYIYSPMDNILVTGCSRMVKVWRLYEWELIQKFDIGINLNELRCYKDYLIFKELIINYYTLEQIKISNMDYFDSKGNIVFLDEYYTLYNLNPILNIQFLFDHPKMFSLKNLTINFK